MDEHHFPGTSPVVGNFKRWWRPAFALLIIALAYFYRLDQPPLWDDEADTGVVARNILRSGYPTAYDGRNVDIFDGRELNKNLVFNRIPWLQFYLGALSLSIFGNTALGLRVLFAVAGVVSFFPIYAVLKSRLQYPVFLAMLVLIAPQVVLFQRNARYYPLLIMLYAILVWHLFKNFKHPRNHCILASVIFVLLFHTHPFAAACASLAVVVFCLFFRREVLGSYLLACGIGGASYLVWHLMLGPPIAEAPLASGLINTNFGAWFDVFCISICATIIDMDVVGCLPILLWLAVLAVLHFRNGNAWRGLFRERLVAFVLLNILIQTVASAAVFGFDGSNQYSLLRYTPHLLVFGIVCTFMVLNDAFANKKLSLVIAVLAVACNFAAFSFWTTPLSRQVPASWFPPVYSGIFHPGENARALALSRLASEAKNAAGHDSVLVTLPYWTQNMANFYLGSKYLVRPTWDDAETAAKCEQALRMAMSAEAFAKLSRPPDWILDYLDAEKSIPDGYELAASIPSHESRPDDGSRPELTRHTFPQSTVDRNVRLFHLRKK